MASSISRRTVLGSAAAGAASLAVGPALAQAAPIRMGGILPFSGPQARTGAITRLGAEIAAAQINAAGGVLGRKIELVWRDDKASPTDSAAAARDLIGSGVNLLFGGNFTATTLAVMPVVAQEKAVFTVLTATTLSITHELFNRNTFRTYPNAYIGFRGLARVMAMKQPDITRWGAVIPDAEYGHASWAAFSSGLKEFYPKIAGKPVELAPPVLTRFGASDYKTQIAGLMQSPYDGLFSALVGGDFFTLLAQGKPFGLLEKIKVLADSGQDLSIGKVAGANIPPIVWSPTLWYYADPAASALSKALYKDIVASANDPYPLGGNWTSHTAITAYANAIKAAGSTDTEAVIKAMESLSFDTAGGPFHFRKEDHQGLPTIGFIKLTPKEGGSPPWEVKDYLKLQSADLAEPATPGKPFVVA